MIALILLAQMLAPQATDSPFFDVLPPQSNAQPGSGSRSPFINVRAAPYLADNTGATDVTSQVALAYADAATSGAAIYFPAGTYKFNLAPIARSGVHISGAGRCRVADTTPIGGTLFVPADLTKPVIQVGDGTALVEKTTLDHFCMRGDGTFSVAGTSTSDGVVINGAYNTTIADFEIGQMGGRCSYVTSSAARSSAYNHFVAGSFMNCSRYGTLVDYGSSFTTATYFTGVNWSPSGIGSGDVDLRVEGSTVWVENSWLQVGDAHAHVYLLKDAGGRAPDLELTNVAIDTGGNSAYRAVDIDLAGGTHRLIGWYIHGSGYFIDGKVHFNDGTTYSGDGSNVVAPPNRFSQNAKIQEKLYFDLETDSGGTEFNDANTPTMYLHAAERTTGGAQPFLEVVGGWFRIPGAFLSGLQFAGGGILWRNPTTGGLRFRKDNILAGNDYDGAGISPALVAAAYGVSVQIDILAGGTIYNIAATNGTAFTIQNPANASQTGQKQQHIEICIINTSGGALGVITPGTNYKLVGGAFPSPATGKRQCVGVREDDDLVTWHETWRSAGDIAN